MGQYYLIANIDRQEFIHPWDFENGAKLCEFGFSGDSTMAGLAILLADGNGRGGGDVQVNPIIGRWAGDRIVIAGDYADGLKFLNVEQKQDRATLQLVADRQFSAGYIIPENVNLYAYAREMFANISEAVKKIVVEELKY